MLRGFTPVRAVSCSSGSSVRLIASFRLRCADKRELPSPSFRTNGIVVPTAVLTHRGSVRRFGLLDVLTKKHESLLNRGPRPGAGTVEPMSEDEILELQSELVAKLRDGCVNEAMADYAVLRAEPGAPVGIKAYQLFLQAAHREQKPEVCLTWLKDMKATNTSINQEDVQLAASCACGAERWDVFLAVLALSQHVSPTPWPRLVELAVQCASRVGRPEEALPLFERVFGQLRGLWEVEAAVPSDAVPDRTTLNTFIASVCAVGNLSLGLDALAYMALHSISPSVASFSPVFDAILGDISLSLGNANDALNTEGADSPHSRVEALRSLTLTLYARMMDSLSSESRGSAGFRDTVVSSIKCCAAAGDSEGAVRMLRDLQAATGRPCFTAVEAVTELTVNAGLTAETFSVFSDAVQLFCRAPPRLIQHDKPDRHLVDTVFKALSDRSCDYANELMKMLGQLRRAGVFVSRIPYSSVLQAMLTTNGGDVSKGLGFVMATATTRPKGQPSDFSVPVYCQLIRALLRESRMDDVDMVLDDMLACNVTPDQQTLMLLLATYDAAGSVSKVDSIKAMLSVRREMDGSKQAAGDVDAKRPVNVTKRVAVTEARMKTGKGRSTVGSSLAQLWTANDSVSTLISAVTSSQSSSQGRPGLDKAAVTHIASALTMARPPQHRKALEFLSHIQKFYTYLPPENICAAVVLSCLDDVKARGGNRESEEWKWLVQARDFLVVNHPTPIQSGTIVALIKAVGYTQTTAELRELFDDASSRGLVDERVCGAMLAQCVHHKDIDMGKSVLAVMDTLNIPPSDSIQALTRRLLAREAASNRPSSSVLPDSVDVATFCKDNVASADDLARIIGQLVLEHREGKAIHVLEASLCNTHDIPVDMVVFSAVLRSLVVKQRRGDVISALRTLDRIAASRKTRSLWTVDTLPTLIAAARFVMVSTTAPERLCSNLVTAVVNCGQSLPPESITASADVLKQAVDTYGFPAVSRAVRYFVNNTQSLAVDDAAPLAVLRSCVRK